MAAIFRIEHRPGARRRARDLRIRRTGDRILLLASLLVLINCDVHYRRELSLGPAATGVAAGLAVSTAPLGATTFATAQIAALVALLVSAIVLESKIEPVESGRRLSLRRADLTAP